MNRFFKIILILTVMFSFSTHCFAEEKAALFSIYDTPEEIEEYEQEYELETEDNFDYSKYEYIDFISNKKTQNEEPAKLFILQTSKDVNFADLNKHPITKISINPHIDDDYKIERGLAAQISTKKLKLGATYAQRSVDYINAIENKISIIPEVNITKNLSFKTKLSKNLSNNTDQSQLSLIYKFAKNKNDLQMEVRAGMTYREKVVNSQSVQFVTKFKI